MGWPHQTLGMCNHLNPFRITYTALGLNFIRSICIIICRETRHYDPVVRSSYDRRGLPTCWVHFLPKFQGGRVSWGPHRKFEGFYVAK